MSKVEMKVLVSDVTLGEGPHWVEEQQCLLFVDIVKGNLHRYFLQSKRHQVLHVEDDQHDSPVTLVVPVKGSEDLFIVSLGRSLVVVEWPVSDPDQHSTKPKSVLCTVDTHAPKNRFNDGKCDPQGRLWAGTMAYETAPGQLELHKGTLYCLDRDLNIDTRVEKISLSNGLAWSKDRKAFYYIDSLAYTVDAFDYDDETGKIGNRRTLLDYKAVGYDKDIPDGMCLDEDGNIWVANYYGQKVICVDPGSGKVIRTLEMPVTCPTSVCWGGPGYSTLFVTSSRLGLTQDQLVGRPQGATLAVTGLGVKGLPAESFAADLNLLKAKMSA